MRQMLTRFRLRQQGPDRPASAFAEGPAVASAPAIGWGGAEPKPAATAGGGLIRWDDSMSVGITLIDRQHRKLVELVNQLFEALRAGKGNDVLATVLGSLVDYTQQHFAEEERMMRAHDYPGVDQHQAAHRALVERVADFQTRFNQGSATISSDLFNFLKDWLLHHIKEQDKAYGPYLNSRGVH